MIDYLIPDVHRVFIGKFLGELRDFLMCYEVTFAHLHLLIEKGREKRQKFNASQKGIFGPYGCIVSIAAL